GTGVATFITSALAPGAHTITAAFAAAPGFTASTSAPLVQTVRTATLTTLVSDANPATLGAPLTLTATVESEGADPAGTVTFFDGATSLGSSSLNAAGVATLSTSALAAGPHLLTASFATNVAFVGSTSEPLAQTIRRTTTTTLVSDANPANLGASVTLTATVAADGATPDGTVTFLDGAISLGSATLDGSGVATLTTSTLAAGSHPLTAVYATTAGFAGSTSEPLAQAIRRATTTALVSDANPANLGASITLTATVSADGATPDGTVTFFDGAISLGSATLDGSGVATFSTSTLAAGPHTLTAVYAATASFAGSTSEPLAQTIRRATTTALVSDANPANLGASVTLTATVAADGATPVGSVTFFDGAISLGSATLDGSGVATLTTAALASGSHPITAVYATTTGFTGSTSEVLNQTIRTAYATWTQTTGLDAFGQPAPTDDPDGDGVNNFLEYALAGDPLQSGTGILPVISSAEVSGALELTFFRARAELTYVVEATSDLTAPTWETLATNPGVVNEPVTVPAPASVGAPGYFLRLRVIATP
ncbi:MAG: Ig-like domain repeat protein, partial [Burkholderiales bacterium]|nr:Ig-like domain repeat protein [Opitutaceae bacterium]